MIQINNKYLRDLDIIAKKHYTRNKQSIINSLENKINDINIDPIRKNFYKDLKRDVESPFKNSILSARPDRLNKKILAYKVKYPNFDFKGKQKKPFKDEVLSIFGYSKYESWGAYDLAKYLNVNVCPYCNRQYTFTINKTGRRKGSTRPEFDHFLDKATYPYLSLSFYNLIPSCHICNSNLKGTQQFSIENNIHPYLEGFGDEVKFSIKLKSKEDFKKKVGDPKNFGVNFFYGKLDSFEIMFKEKEKPSPKDKIIIQKANMNIRAFHLDELYSSHKDVITELIQKAIIYHSNNYVDDLCKDFKGMLFNNRDDVLRMVTSNYITEEEIEKRPLAKLTRDIAEELGLL
jgi:hypothetical protein